ncbi:hypothetical protein [Phyllobacterium zundukense]|uniref:Uncharacterized protein n=1 Tax=Phyllobacterium zundukense TaxID=1867719 RepID=A0A2N9W4V8_9HYPH|nr:hypothetical protein [Phyllobacterium zundukense]ATU91758.1 hypothetical protein BLM14_09100 [Phyllobacterium zundukense]PIO46776.1 hypothetical protein B5P45_02975 [Phyllobacterium zundukense]
MIWLRFVGVISALLLMQGTARADITLFMNAWDYLPLVEIAQGRNDDCKFNEVIKRVANMSAGYSETFSGTGNGGDDLCWRRTADPGRSADDDFNDWTRCSWDGQCEIR